MSSSPVLPNVVQRSRHWLDEDSSGCLLVGYGTVNRVGTRRDGAVISYKHPLSIFHLAEPLYCQEIQSTPAIAMPVEWIRLPSLSWMDHD